MNGSIAFFIILSALTALATVVQTVFYARFYVAAREREDAAQDAPLVQ